MQTNLFQPSIVIPVRAVRVEFDGGTPCNIPRLGYGDGYGSFRIDTLPIVRLDFGTPMSANAAEVLTLCRALESIESPELAHVIILGDSKIALNQAVPPPRIRRGVVIERKIKSTGSGPFQDACIQVRALIAKFASAETIWRGRAASVALFGH